MARLKTNGFVHQQIPNSFFLLCGFVYITTPPGDRNQYSSFKPEPTANLKLYLRREEMQFTVIKLYRCPKKITL